jgi:hypothetical protein
MRQTISLAVMLLLLYGGVLIGRRPDTREGMAGSPLMILLPLVAVALVFAAVAVGSGGGWVLAGLGALTAGVFAGAIAD